MYHSTIHNANDRHLHWIWNEYPCHTLLDNVHVFHDRTKHLHILAIEEPYLYGPSKFTNQEIEANWGNTKTDVILGHYPIHTDEHDWIKENDTLEVLKPKRHYFPLFFLYYAFTRSAHFGEPKNQPIPKIEPKAIWTYYCRAPRTHRYLFLELAASAKLLDSNIYTYNKNLEKFDPIGSLKQEFNYEGGNFDYVHKLYSKDKYTGGDWMSDNSADAAFADSVFHIAGETMYEVCFWTEKTFVPLMLGKPVIVQGGRHCNERLQYFGFKLFDNVIDYSFDYRMDVVDRTKALVEQLKILENKYTPEELYELTKEIADHNKKVALDIITTKKFIPSVYFKWLSIYKDSKLAQKGPFDWYNSYCRKLKEIC